MPVLAPKKAAPQKINEKQKIALNSLITTVTGLVEYQASFPNIKLPNGASERLNEIYRMITDNREIGTSELTDIFHALLYSQKISPHLLHRCTQFLLQIWYNQNSLSPCIETLLTSLRDAADRIIQESNQQLPAATDTTILNDIVAYNRNSAATFGWDNLPQYSELTAALMGYKNFLTTKLNSQQGSELSITLEKLKIIDSLQSIISDKFEPSSDEEMQKKSQAIKDCLAGKQNLFRALPLIEQSYLTKAADLLKNLFNVDVGSALDKTKLIMQNNRFTFHTADKEAPAPIPVKA